MLDLSPLDEGDGLAFAGTLDLSTADAARAKLEPMLRPGAALTFDLGRLEFMDSTGINLIVGALRILGDDGRLTLRAPSGIVGKLLSVSGLSDRPNLVVLPA